MNGAAVAAMARLLTEKALSHGVPGAAMALVEGAEVEACCTGFADVARRIPMDAGVLCQAASLSKTFTALAILHLVEAGRLDLDAPVWRYVARVPIPRSPFDADAVTVHRILSHSAGLNVPDYPGFAPGAACPAPEESLAGIGVTTDPLTIVQAPGSAFAYSGAGFTLLQILIEEVSGIPFAAFMKAAVLDPLGMTASCFGDPPEKGCMAQPHDAEGSTLPLYRYEAQAAAGLYTTAADLGRFLAAAGRGIAPASRQRWAAMTTTHRLTGGVDGLWGAYGLGCEIGAFAAGSVAGHHGINRGWRALMGVQAASGRGLAVLVNGDAGSPLCEALAEAWFTPKDGAGGNP